VVGRAGKLVFIGLILYAPLFLWLFRHLGPGSELAALPLLLLAARGGGAGPAALAALLMVPLHWGAYLLLADARAPCAPIAIPGAAGCIPWPAIGYGVGLPPLLWLAGRAPAAGRAGRPPVAPAADAADDLLAARRALRERDDLLATVVHDLRTPLGALAGIAESLSGRLAAGADRDAAALALRAAHNLLDLVDELQRPGGGVERHLLRERPFRPVRLAADEVALMRPLFEARGLILTLAPAPSLPAQLIGPPLLLRRLLGNLLGNSLEATARGEVQVQLALAGDAPAGGRLVLRVIDSGPGLTPGALRQALEGESGAVPGGPASRGLGLGICRQLAALAGGGLRIRSRPGVGTRVEVWLPVRPATRTVAPEVTAPRPRTAALRVLIVDDDPVTRQSLAGLLRGLGAEVRAAGDAAESLADGGRWSSDAVFADQRLPDLTGDELLRRLPARIGSAGRQWRVLMTANPLTVDLALWADPALDLVLTKPLGRGDLDALLGRVRAGAPPRPDADGEGLLDGPFLDTECRALGLPAVADLARVYADGSRRDLEAAVLALGAGDTGELALFVHRVASAAANVGLPRLAEAARALEKRSLGGAALLDLSLALKALAVLQRRSGAHLVAWLAQQADRS
jgi:signal transduction histidine kinase/CheY-like chemotaxis protein